MKKIIIFSKNLNIGGREKALITLINYIDLQQYEVNLVLEKAEGKLLQKLDKKVKVVDYNLCTSQNIIKRKLINGIKKFKFILGNYHKYNYAINYATYSIFGSKMAILSSKNRAIFIHSDYYNVYKGDIGKIKEFFESICIEKFNKVIFVSKQPMSNMINIMPELRNKSELLGNLVDYKEILKQAEEYKVDFDKNKTNIVYVGRLDEQAKQISKLIQANNNNENIEKYNLCIIGTGPDEDKYKEMAKTNNIYFIGEKANPYPYIKAADYLILTSKYEGFPVVYNEAAVLNTKIITTITVEDEEIKYDDNNIIKLEKKLENFDNIIEQIIKAPREKQRNNINFETINKQKINRFYEVIGI